MVVAVVATGIPSLFSSRNESVAFLTTTISDAWSYLQFPSYVEYRTTCYDACYHVWLAAKSIFMLLFLTFRPLCLLLWGLGKILFQHLLSGFYISTKQTLFQIGNGIRIAWKFQTSLNRQQLAIELIVIIVLVSIYLLRQYIEKHGYIKRIRKWYQLKQRRVLQVSSKILKFTRIGTLGWKNFLKSFNVASILSVRPDYLEHVKSSFAKAS